MDILRIAAFSDGDKGGNPAGVVLLNELPDAAQMQAVAADVGYSETAFAAPQGAGWRVRYFSPESEVPFCGHATIALGAALALEKGEGRFNLVLNDADIMVEGARDGERIAAALQSPPTGSRRAEQDILKEALALFGYRNEDLDDRIPPAVAEAGATHLVLALKDRQKLAAMNYDLDAGRTFMRKHNLVTVSLIYVEAPGQFQSRNPFASGGVLEDPATGAAAAALAGYLRDLNWPHGGSIEIRQGVDMGIPSILTAEIPPEPGSSIRVSGTARMI